MFTYSMMFQEILRHRSGIAQKFSVLEAVEFVRACLRVAERANESAREAFE
jgi:hypothetical protein